MTPAANLPRAITPDQPGLFFGGFVELRRKPDFAAGVRPVAGTVFNLDAPGAFIRFRLQASAAEAVIAYKPKADMPGRVHYQSTGVVLMDGKRQAAFTRPADAGGAVRVPLVSGDGRAHVWSIVLPYADVVAFRGLRLASDGRLLEMAPDIRPHYVACGDSITHGFRAGDALSGYAWQLAERMGWRLTNLGFGSRTVVPEDAGIAAGLAPDIVTILLGVNDCLGKIPAGTIRRNYDAMLGTLRQACPETPLVMITPLAFPLPTQWVGLEPVEECRAVLRSLAGEWAGRNVVLVEGPALIPPDEQYFADGLHPNDTGFAVMAGRLAAALVKAGVSVKTTEILTKGDLPQGTHRTQR